MQRRPSSRSWSGKPAFTLIEMLVVIFVVGLLLALIVPSVYRLREMARSAQCTSNLRQLYGTVMARATDHGGAFPYAASFDTWSTTRNTWVPHSVGWVHYNSLGRTMWYGNDATNSIQQGTLWAYTQDRGIYLCPTFQLRSQTSWIRPGTTQNYTGLNTAHRSYVMSRTLDGISLYSLKRASSKVLFADGNISPTSDGERISAYGLEQATWNEIPGPPNYGKRYLYKSEDGMLEGSFWAVQGGVDRPNEAIGTYHNGFANVVFADGHTERLLHTKTIDIYSGNYEP